MPTHIDYRPRDPWSIDKKLWMKCEKLAREAMLAAGWEKLSWKFNGVHRKKSMQLWNKLRTT